MRRVAQRLRDGELRVVDGPSPEHDDYSVLVRTQASLISAGTERAKVTLARESVIGKARRRPDQVRQVLDRAQREGVRSTLDAVRARLDALAPLGYCAAGRVERVGARVQDIRPGDLVACGGEAAGHADQIAVPGNLCIRIPDGVDVRQASFATLGAIAMHGFRQGDLRVGERVAVVGMGLVGQLTARIAKAAGCRVLGIDLEQWRLDAASAAGALDDARLRGDVGVGDLERWDAVVVTAAAPQSSDPISLATDLARDRGTVVVVGDVRLDLDRRRFYEKELDLRLARSYGPGRYDAEYEQRGLDYPLPYVRWTERRNMESFLELVARRSLAVDDLISHEFTIDQASAAFDLLSRREERSLGIVLTYPEGPVAADDGAPTVRASDRRPAAAGTRIGFIGAGSFAQRILIPLARDNGLRLERVATSTGLTAAAVAERFAFARGACSPSELLDDPDVDAVAVATRHDRHADLALAALRAGKATFVEKPLCLDESELAALAEALGSPTAPPLIVGFNRRHAPFTRRALDFVGAEDGPTTVVVRVAAGPLPRDHWLNDPEEGGGRLVGEGCHFFDLALALVGRPPISVVAQGDVPPGAPVRAADSFAATIRFDDGSLASIVYGSAGSPRLGKEHLEVHRGRRSARIDDFRRLTLWAAGRPRSERARRAEKGHAEELALFASVLRGETSAPPPESYLTSMATTFAALRALTTGREEAVGRYVA